jgi:hypothetical protein
MEIQSCNNLILTYFSGFGKKNVDQITSTLSEYVSLTDWNSHWSGYESVRGAILDLLEENSSINITPVSIHYSSTRSNVLATCVIDINTVNRHGERTNTRAVNLIEIQDNTFIDPSLRITSINSFKQ